MSLQTSIPDDMSGQLHIATLMCLNVAQIVPNFRVRTIPVLGTMPAIFGLAAASYILCQLAGAPFQPEPIFRLTEGQYETQLQRLAEREGLVYGNSEGPAVDLDDVSPSSRDASEVAWALFQAEASFCIIFAQQTQYTETAILQQGHLHLTSMTCAPAYKYNLVISQLR